MIRPALLALAFATAAAVGAAPYEAGVHYKLVEPAIPTSAKPGQVEVIEFFSIGCPHCAEFEPFLQSWIKRKPKNVKFIRVPASGGFAPLFKPLARAYYALEDVKAADRAVPLLFEAIHARRDPDLLRPLGEYNNSATKGDAVATAAAEQQLLSALTMFLAREAGVDPKRFRGAWSSFSMNTRLAQADTLFRKYGVRGVPALVINGKYYTGPGRPLAVRDFDELMKVTDYLIGLETKPAK
jgi:thiol:disulfide interchange protein DsbA